MTASVYNLISLWWRCVGWQHGCDHMSRYLHDDP